MPTRRAYPDMADHEAIGLAFTCNHIERVCGLLREDRKYALSEPRRERQAVTRSRQMFTDAKGFALFMRGGEYHQGEREFPDPAKSLQICFYIFGELELIKPTTTVQENLELISRFESTLQILETDLDRTLLDDEDLKLVYDFFAVLGSYCRGLIQVHMGCW